MTAHFDVVIIGGGPAGSLTASLLRRHDPDKSVLVIDAEKHPRHRVGESTIPSWRDTLHEAGLLEKIRNAGFMWKVGTLFYWGKGKNKSWTIDFREYAHEEKLLTSWQLDRARFDALCFQHAAELGATVSEGDPVKAVVRTKSGFVVKTGHRDYSADFVVDASGSSRVLSKLWKLPAKTWPDLNNFAIYSYWKGSKIAEFGDPLKPGQRWTYIGTTRDGWLWHIPIEEDLVSIGLVTHKSSLPSGGKDKLQELYLENLFHNEHVAELLENAEQVSHPLAKSRLMTVRDWSYAAEQTCGEGWFLVGDAASFVDPIFSTGLLFTAHGSSLVANALHTLWNDSEVDPDLLRSSYDESYQLLTRTYYSLARVWYSRNFTVDSLHWESKRRLLGTGTPVSEQAEAFNQLLMGSFLSPFDSPADEPQALCSTLTRRDGAIYREKMFDDAPDKGLEFVDSQSARQTLSETHLRQWRAMLNSKIRLSDVSWKVEERYYTNARWSRWRRLPHLVVKGDADSLFPGIAVPFESTLPQHLLPKLDGSTLLTNVLEDLLQTTEAKTDPDRFSLRAFSLVNFLHAQGWLEGVEPTLTMPVELCLPPPVLELLQEQQLLENTRVTVNVLGILYSFHTDGLGGWELTDRSTWDYGFLQTRHSHLNHQARSLDNTLEAFLGELARRLDDWEETLDASWWKREGRMSIGYTGPLRQETNEAVGTKQRM